MKDKNMKHKMIVRCNRCGKVAPIDEKKTTDRFTVYKTKEPCECGGTFVWLHVYEKLTP